MRIPTRIASFGAATLLALSASVTVLPGTALMATLTRTYFDNPDYTVTYDYDDVALKLTAIHSNNRTSGDISFQILRSADDVVLRTLTAPPGISNVPLTGAQQASIILDSRGRITNIYARTI